MFIVQPPPPKLPAAPTNFIWLRGFLTIVSLVSLGFALYFFLFDAAEDSNWLGIGIASAFVFIPGIVLHLLPEDKSADDVKSEFGGGGGPVIH